MSIRNMMCADHRIRFHFNAMSVSLILMNRDQLALVTSFLLMPQISSRIEFILTLSEADSRIYILFLFCFDCVISTVSGNWLFLFQLALVVKW